MFHLKQLLNNPFTLKLEELYDLGMTDLNANLEAIDLAKGNLDYAYNYLLDGKDD
jgi:hypothetical protein